MKTIYLFLISSFFVVNNTTGQQIIDSCFTSATPVSSTGFISSANLVNTSSADLLSWNGTNWTGGFPGANLTIPPPTNTIGCRAIFTGNSSSWTSGGECFALRLTSPLIVGQNYVFNFTTVSHGLGSNGNFSPFVYTNSTSTIGGSFSVGNIAPAGYTWSSSLLSFTATASQAGHQWLIIGTQPSGSSGLISSFCSNCIIPTSLSIELSSFDAICSEEEIELKWVTETETNNDFFTIERSRDGTTFETVQTINGSGTSTSKKYYSFIDKNKVSEKSYYRLSQTDYNGAGKVFAIQIAYCEQKEIIELFPNPFENEIIVKSNYAGIITLVDLMGTVVHEQKIESKTNVINLSNIVKGTYVAKITLDNNQSEIRKIIKH